MFNYRPPDCIVVLYDAGNGVGTLQQEIVAFYLPLRPK